MNKTVAKHIEIYVHWAGLDNALKLGTLHATQSRGKEIFSFEYSDEWLNNKKNYLLDPDLQFFPGIHYAPGVKNNFGIFLDSSPDRWGRVLMDRREALLAREQEKSPRRLLESDYLLGVHDEQRMGALRFRLDPNGPFLDNNKHIAAPPWTSLRELEYASLALEKENSENNPNYSKWLQMLIIPGSSLGGSRPKASVLDEKQNLWIAKFPSSQDNYDIGAWEMVLHELAQSAKISIPSVNLKKLNNNSQHTFLSKRFDRTKNNERIHFASALTLLQRNDGDDATLSASYLELADFIIRHGANIKYDLEQLWRRIVFNICVSNVDDHLRNHGFLLQENGWVLAPAYDMNPVPEANGLRLNISDTDNAQNLALAKEVAAYFRISSSKANTIIKEVSKSVAQWGSVATKYGISSKEQKHMSSAFRFFK